MKRFGFGAMRLPMVNGEVDKEQFNAMIDEFLAAGFTYFDTAHGYLDGKSETAIRDCLAERYPRESFVLANKLSAGFFKTRDDVLPLFEEQLRCCGVDYFDYYLIHAMSGERYDLYRDCGAFEIIPQLKCEGRVRHFGMSFHDKAEVLDRILTEQPELEFVQLQFNYLDYEDPVVESRKCYEVCVKHGKRVSVMEPVKGGALAELPADAGAILDALGGGSHASYALRFAEGFENVYMVLSGMSSIEQMRDNLATMSDFRPLDETELAAVRKVAETLRGKGAIPCTACRYCTSGCPMGIDIPSFFSCYNSKVMFGRPQSSERYAELIKNGTGPNDCMACGHCEEVCPQHLRVRSLLRDVAEEFDA